jgi:hypothetical protein
MDPPSGLKESCAALIFHVPSKLTGSAATDREGIEVKATAKHIANEPRK